MRISDWSSDVCSSDLRHPRAPRAPAPPAPCRSIAPGRNSPRIGGQRLDHALVEHTRLVAVENGAHREEMFQRFLLQRPHDLMAVVDRLGHARAIAMFGRSEEHTSELQSLMRISYAVFCLKKNKN